MAAGSHNRGRVVSVWTQNPEVSQHVARACRIPSIAMHMEDLIGKTDAILLARDDAENHLEHARPFLDEGLPVYIDKPFATSIADFESLYAHERFAGQIFTCSALRYSEDWAPTAQDWALIGELRHVHAVTPKSWRKYAVHIIEPVLKLLASR
ncbi:MAG: Gfo/Idh/MocA family oxidoreductase [Arhodomonas sp.]|nr:Gfo/Idh/MocA family oxidoreductase [Arhodomonas sp.]